MVTKDEGHHLLAVTPIGEWTVRGACTNKDPELFFPTFSTTPREIAEAKSTCKRCPVLAECRRWALDNGSQVYGIWGGTTDQERKDARAAKRAAARAAKEVAA